MRHTTTAKPVRRIHQRLIIHELLKHEQDKTNKADEERDVMRRPKEAKPPFE